MLANSRCLRSSALTCAVALLTLLASDHASGQTPAITATEPQAIAPGSTVDVLIRGGNLTGATQLWSSFSTKSSLTPDVAENGTKDDQVMFRVSVAADAALGVHGMRIATDKGVSAMRLFVLDDLATVANPNTNKTIETAHRLTPPVAVDGVVDALSRNYFHFRAQAGQQLSMEVLARRIGSALDPLIRLLDTSGREITYSDDAAGLGGDPQISHTFQEAGEYVLELRDIRYQGGGNYNYRLRIGDFPCINVPYPMGAKRGTEATLSFAGTSVDQAEEVKVAVPDNPLVNWVNVSAKRTGGSSSGFATLSVSSADELQETEPNDSGDEVTSVPLGAQLNGRLEKTGDVDRFRFSATKDQQFTFAAITRQQGSPADLLLRLYNADGAKVAEAEDAGVLDGVIRYKFPADGEYTLHVEDLYRRGGDPFAYRIEVKPTKPGFRLAASTDHLNIPAGGTAMLTVTSSRTNYNGPIAVWLVDLPDGVTSMPTVIGTGLNGVVFTVQSARDAPTGGAMPARIIGTATIGGEDFQANASITAALKVVGNGMPLPPPVLETAVAVGIAPTPAISLRAEPSVLIFGRDLSATVKVIAERQDGWDEEIALAVTPEKNGLPGGITAALKPIPRGAGEVEIVFSANDTAPMGEFTGVLTGTIKKDKATVTQAVPGIGLTLQRPFTLRIAPKDGKLAKNSEKAARLMVERNPAFKGAIKVNFQNLPKGVTAEIAEIPAGRNEIAFKLKASAEAEGTATNVTVKGDATLGKATLTATSPAVSVAVE